MVVTDCDRFRNGCRVVVTLLWVHGVSACCDLVFWILTGCWCDQMLSTDTYGCCICVCTLCEAAVLCYDEFGAGGTCGGVVPAQLLCCGYGLMLSWSLIFTGLVLVLHCNVNGYLFQCKIFHSLDDYRRFSAVVLLWGH